MYKNREMRHTQHSRIKNLWEIVRVSIAIVGVVGVIATFSSTTAEDTKLITVNLHFIFS